MLDLTRFSHMFSNLGAGFNTGSLPAVPKTASPGIPKVSDGVPKDILDINPVKSGQASGSFDEKRPVAPNAPVAVADTGIYRPTAVQQSLNSRLSFSFNLSIQRATVSQRPTDALSILSQDTKQFSYKELLAAQGNRSGSYSEVRQFQTDLFFKRTRTLSQSLSSETGQHLDATSQKVARRFDIEISLDVSFLKQFNVQTETLSGSEDTLGQYLDGVDGLSSSGQALQSFFYVVDAILADTEGFVKDTLGSFLADVKSTFGLDDQEAADFSSALVDEIHSFFNDVGDFLHDAKNMLMAPPAPPASSPQAQVQEATSPALV